MSKILTGGSGQHITAAQAVSYVEGRLGADEVRRLEAHVQGCGGCENSIRNMRAHCAEEDGRIAAEWFLERPTCPPQDELQQYADDKLPSQRHEAVRLHLELAGCEACQAVLDAIRTNDPQAQALLETVKARIKKEISTRRK